MLRLNDDCLSSIFDHLRLQDQLRLTAVCNRFRDIILSIQWRSRFQRFVTCEDSEIEELSAEEYQSLLKQIVHRIEHLIINNFDHHSTTKDILRQRFILYESFELPVLRVLDCNTWLTSASGCDLELIATHCPLIEELYLPKLMVDYEVGPYIVRMRHLRKLHLPNAIFEECELKQILTLPLTELRILAFRRDSDPRSLAEALIGASDLRDFQMVHCRITQDLMKSMVDLASKTKHRDPLTVCIFEEVEDNKDTKLDEIETEYHEGDEDPYLTDDDDSEFFTPSSFKAMRNIFSHPHLQKYKHSLKALIDNQLANPTYTILISQVYVEFRFSFASNK